MDKLPPATQTGAYTFACLIDGQPWIVKGLGSGMNAQHQTRDFITISGDKDNNGILFILKGSQLEGKTFNLSDSTQGDTYAGYNVNEQLCQYEPNNVIDGFVKITYLNLQYRIVSGTFELTVYNPDCGDTVRITDGRFDIPELVL